MTINPPELLEKLKSRNGAIAAGLAAPTPAAADWPAKEAENSADDVLTIANSDVASEDGATKKRRTERGSKGMLATQ
ncbi:hypothetical protein BDW60DRAFT_207421 [Aspergillus nidulans var. acristatus]